MKLTPIARTQTSRRHAFTLIEVLVVMAILVILAGIASIALFRNVEDAKKNQAMLKAKTISNAIDAYMTNPANPGNSAPTQLTDLVNVPFGGSSFLKDGMNDLMTPWNKEFDISPGQGNDGSTIYYVWTQAPDGVKISQFGVGPNARVP